MNFSIQTPLANEEVALYPLKEADFDALYAVAADPAVWEQHPNKDRWKKEVFSSFFAEAIQSQGAFKIMDKKSGNTVGSTRFYHYDGLANRIFIGYTFYARACWGTGFNRCVKDLMLSYIFQFVDEVCFQVGAENIRSQIALERLGALKIDEEQLSNQGEGLKRNFLYAIKKSVNKA